MPGRIITGFRVIQDRTQDILKAEEKATARIFRRSGGLIRGIARRSIRPGGKKGRKSDPGKPSRTHVRSSVIGAKAIVWDYNAKMRLLRVGQKSKAGESGRVIEVLGFGGVSQTTIRIPIGQGRDPAGRFTRQRFRLKKAAVRIAARPTMAPAGRIFEQRYVDLYRNAI